MRRCAPGGWVEVKYSCGMCGAARGRRGSVLWIVPQVLYSMELIVLVRDSSSTTGKKTGKGGVQLPLSLSWSSSTVACESQSESVSSPGYLTQHAKMHPGRNLKLKKTSPQGTCSYIGSISNCQARAISWSTNWRPKTRQGSKCPRVFLGPSAGPGRPRARACSGVGVADDRGVLGGFSHGALADCGCAVWRPRCVSLRPIPQQS